MHLRKKGQAESGLSPVMKLILGIITIVILVPLIVMFFFQGSEIASERVCQASVRISSGTFALAQKVGIDTLMCYSEEVKSEAKTKDEALDDIAEHMRKCWEMWGEGTKDPKGENVWYGREDKCFTCYKLNFSDLEEEVSIKNIFRYLDDERPSKEKDLKKEISYWNYFKKSSPSNLVITVLPAIEEDCSEETCNVIDKDKLYAVTYHEDVKASVIGHLITSAYFGSKVGGALCFIGIAAGLVSGGATTFLCVPALTVTASFVNLAPIVKEKLLDKLRGGVHSDGIGLVTYDSARRTCRTEVRIKPKKIDESIYKDFGGDLENEQNE